MRSWSICRSCKQTADLVNKARKSVSKILITFIISVWDLRTCSKTVQILRLKVSSDIPRPWHKCSKRRLAKVYTFRKNKARLPVLLDLCSSDSKVTLSVGWMTENSEKKEKKTFYVKVPFDYFSHFVDLLVGLWTTGFWGLKIDWPAFIGEVKTVLPLPSKANCLLAIAVTTGDLNLSPTMGAEKM